MNKNIEVCWHTDRSGCSCIQMRKKKGRFTLDEIVDTARNFEQGYYAVIIKAVDMEMDQYFDVEDTGDFITLYDATNFLEKKED